jgi:tRNA threonylcarbamoyladenosine biosynthesis protein TsaE
MTRVYQLNSEQDTKELAEKIAPLLKKGDVLTLYGDLGSGKTFFTKYLGVAIGVKEIISSPTFVLLNIYQAESLKLYHLDLYRINDYEDVWSLGLEELFEEGITVIEWPLLAEPILPKERRQFTINYKKGKRWVTVEADSLSLPE